MLVHKDLADAIVHADDEIPIGFFFFREKKTNEVKKHTRGTGRALDSSVQNGPWIRDLEYSPEAMILEPT
jgi:hypothetical protein